MTEEQIKQQAEKYAGVAPTVVKSIRYEAYLAGAHCRDEEIKELEDRNKVLDMNLVEQQLENLQLSNPWISVEERLPEEGKDVFVRKTCTNGIFHLTGKVLNGGKWYCYGFGWQDSGVITHWMPIPELKKGEASCN